ncbi:MAG: MarR family winged helix-turn-helix transcriptional regulator [Lachnospiraceae bacterium]|jgi:DNA-binding MarR family transcriptional regulator
MAETAEGRAREQISRGKTAIHVFNQLNNELNALYHSAAVRNGMSDSEHMILYMLTDVGDGITQSEIMTSCCMSKQTVNSAIAKMQKEGLLTLGEKTGRQKRIFLTDIGKQTIQEKIVPLMKLEDAIVQSWTPEEQSIYLRLEEQFRDGLREGLRTLWQRQGYSFQTTSHTAG